MAETFEDRRRFFRFLIELPLKFIKKYSNLEGQGKTRDISAAGVGMFAPEDLKERTSIELWIEVPDGHEPLYTQGEVVWSKMIDTNKYAIGISLYKVDLMAMSRIVKAAHVQMV